MTNDPSRGDLPICRVDRLYREGFGSKQIAPNDPCPICCCRFGDHQIALLGNTITALLRDPAGTVECDRCNQICGPWSVSLNG